MTYTSALGRLPKRVEQPKPYEAAPDPPDFADDGAGNSLGEEKEEKPQVVPEHVPLSGLELECAKARAVLNANIGACHVKLVEL